LGFNGYALCGFHRIDDPMAFPFWGIAGLDFISGLAPLSTPKMGFM
jgi:hypothetical protein